MEEPRNFCTLNELEHAWKHVGSVQQSRYTVKDYECQNCFLIKSEVDVITKKITYHDHSVVEFKDLPVN
jgi:hypothetical protein